MPEFEDLSFVAENFSGRARLFPLPSLVLFPHVMQPLHVFEPRYKKMLEEAMADDRLIATAVLVPGWEKDYEGRPPIHAAACLGRVASCQRQPGGTYNILLLGLRRVALVRELPPKKLFREAVVEVREDVYPADAAHERARLQRQLLEAIEKLLPQMANAEEQMHQLLKGNIPLGMLADILAFTLNLKVEAKATLLAESNVNRRAELLIDHLHHRAADDDPATRAPFPPEFSSN